MMRTNIGREYFENIYTCLSFVSLQLYLLCLSFLSVHFLLLVILLLSIQIELSNFVIPVILEPFLNKPPVVAR